MTNRENFLSIAHRTGYETMPVSFDLCPALRARFDAYVRETGFRYDIGGRSAPDLIPDTAAPEDFLKYYGRSFKSGTEIDMWGVAHEPGSAAAFHMTRMYHPMANPDSVEQVMTYPMPVYSDAGSAEQAAAIADIHAQDLIAGGGMAMTMWKQAWYLRGMENLMTDMMDDDPIAEAIFDRVTATAKAIKPDILIQYHSCGFVTPMIPHLMDAGVEILNPVQPECMRFEEIREMYGDRLSFNGTIGTQPTMPFGTPVEIRREVFRNLEIAGDKGGLFCAPTHMPEPEVPLENLPAYINACKEFKG